ncbi:nuclear RNA export factor 2 [Drosophila takahashii]|uniref:nuclear RNA export factor 2 n=1 Tax=Drosophila takahashii TaxID=29030 RepID=UPI001CF8964A|nr:nuclear RNA export factor 2 [Drosophila takahashii]
MPAKIRVLDFGDGSAPIQLDYPDSKIFSNCSSYEDRVPGSHWSEITVHHRNNLNFAADQMQMIMDGLYQAVDKADFFPVCYQAGSRADSMLVRNCKDAIDNLFNQRLTISVNRIPIPISVQLGVAKYRTNQISPMLRISCVIDRLMKSLVQRDGVDNLLDLSNFSAHPEFKNIVVSLGNPSCLMHVCKVMHNNDLVRFRVNGFILSNNNIRSIRPLTLFANVDYALLDLRGNQIRSADRLCRDLEQFRARELLLDNNPICKSEDFPNNIKPLRGNFNLVDGKSFNLLRKRFSPLEGEIDLEVDGARIDANTKWNLQGFANSPDWHAFMIPDPQHEFEKEVLFDFFFIKLDPSLTEFYPCYYKYIKTDHVFLVRNCFDQIEHLVNKCNLELDLPTDRIFRYHLRMNVSTYKQHHLDPEKCIQKAVSLCFVPQNRLLNLERFQFNESLQDVVVSLSSAKILSYVLSVASRQFMATCSEIRLCRNKILHVDKVNVLTQMGCLRAVDLSHNWLLNLDSIKFLGNLPLKSLVLHGNQLCRNYSLPSEYVQAVKEVFPQLTTLDGVDLQTKPGQSMQKNFLCDIGAYELVGQVFLKNYLQEFESDELRGDLAKYYSNDSIFTLTCNYHLVQNHQTRLILPRIAKYNKHGRNLHNKDFSRASNSVYIGTDEILGVLFQLPRVTHDFHSLQTDVMHYDGKMAVIYVTGLLRDEPPVMKMTHGNRPEIGGLLLGFSRQFVVKFEEDGLGLGKRARRLKITNERLHITSPSKNMIRNAFSVHYPDPSERTVKEDCLDVKDHKLLLFQEVTGLISTWCTSIVEQADWDFERALKLFVQKNADQEIPDFAFA